jgi:hypothetical protein
LTPLAFVAWKFCVPPPTT